MATNSQTNPNSTHIGGDALLSVKQENVLRKEEIVAHNDNKTQRQRNIATQELLSTWLADESGYEEETWSSLKSALENNRPNSRQLFRD